MITKWHSSFAMAYYRWLGVIEMDKLVQKAVNRIQEDIVSYSN